MIFSQKQLNNFWSKVDKTEHCWNWTGYKAYGYGKVCISANVYFAHRVSAVIAGKLEVPRKKELGSTGKIIMHTCDNRKCVNPEHLVVATNAENMHDAWVKKRKWHGRLAGENNPKSKLSNDIVNQIRSLDFKASYWAELLKVSKSTIHCVMSGKTWKGL